ncbi:hypothetical protein HH303_00090 [Rhodospirillaceae bacterium KN72]|uniref:PAS domain-containing protein n=1 Tax=Pacificispira spongiicola TaxID=2729598 RepID=A0A7Y0DXY1_9PROT|nr:hypothetical protein [Pacificispira spongiicola]NMM42856.1 hypothetical protein [Pacificispira spongiicola]
MGLTEDVRRIIDADRDWMRQRFLMDTPFPPQIVWHPDPDSLPFPLLTSFVRSWRDMPRVDGGLPSVDDFDIVDFRKPMKYLMYLDVLDGGADFQYRVYGTGISQVSGFDLTGMRLSETHIPPVTRDFMMACYGAVVSRRDLLFTEHHPPVHFKIATWSRVLAPLVDATGAVARIVAINYPDRLRDPTDGVRPLTP